MKSQVFIHKQHSPVLVTAIHDGHFIPPALLEHIGLEEHERMREEDPYTADIADLSANRIIVGTSRFITDLNRPRNKCIYKMPEDAWGLQVWEEPISVECENHLLAYYDYFYACTAELIREIVERYGYFAVLDLHSYNHRRESPALQANEEDNPEINIGTAHNLPKWQPLISDFIQHLSDTDINGHYPDVRENVKFQGGEFSRWICRHFGNVGFVLSVEFKKTFMDEWTGRVNISHLQALKLAMQYSIPFLTEKLKHFKEQTSV